MYQRNSSFYNQLSLEINRILYLPEEGATCAPSVDKKAVDRHVKKHHGHRVVKKTENEDGVDSVGRTAHEEKHVGRQLEINNNNYNNDNNKNNESKHNENNDDDNNNNNNINNNDNENIINNNNNNDNNNINNI